MCSIPCVLEIVDSFLRSNFYLFDTKHATDVVAQMMCYVYIVPHLGFVCFSCVKEPDLLRSLLILWNGNPV
jgi:hypothetical protein